MESERALLRQDGDVWELYLPLSPVPAARPRVGRWGTYYPKTYQRYMATADDMLLPLAYGTEPTGETVHVAAHFVVAKPRTGKLPDPAADLDNYVKAAYDAVTRAQIIWRDDKQIKTMHASKRYALGGEVPHTFIKASLSMGGIWLPAPLEGIGEDVYDLPPSMRVPLSWVGGKVA